MSLRSMLLVYSIVFFHTSLVIFTQSHKARYRKERELWVENWTSCDEFLFNASFDFKKVVNVDWKIFYFWNHEEERSYNIRFSLTTPSLVDRFKVELINMSSSVDWSKAVLFMETTIDLSALYITTEKSGLFRLIPSLTFQHEYEDDIPKLLFGLKLVEPGYLGIMNCDTRYCYALAPEDKMPGKDDIKIAAEKIGFKGDFNRSYLFKSKPVSGVFHKSDVSNSLEEEDDIIDMENEIE